MLNITKFNCPSLGLCYKHVLLYDDDIIVSYHYMYLYNLKEYVVNCVSDTYIMYIVNVLLVLIIIT